jgi:MoxR-like ATPase
LIIGLDQGRGISVHAVTDFTIRFRRIAANIRNVVQGRPEVVDRALTCLFAEGHLLIEDVPGVAKTTMAKAIAGSIEGGSFKRVQFTPDLLPSDVTGGQVFNFKEQRFEFVPGPVFCHVLVADEINRASPKTQSALLQVMAEGQVTSGDQTYQVEPPFLCIATQNPIEHHGTYPLPLAQLDRFMMKISMGGYPDAETERSILAWAVGRGREVRVPAVVTSAEVLDMMKAVRSVEVGQRLQRYIVDIADRTRDRGSGLEVGASPRASIALAMAAQAKAAVEGREYATADDAKTLAVPVLAHRLVPTTESRLKQRSAASLLDDILSTLPVSGSP